MASPVYVDENGVKFNPDIMVRERLYHCMSGDKAILVFKDSQDVMNCYEIEDPPLVEKIRQCNDDVELEALFDAYILDMNLNG